MLKHIKDKHPNSVASYTAKVKATVKDCLTRQVREAVHLRRSEVPTLYLEDDAVIIICVSVTS